MRPPFLLGRLLLVTLAGLAGLGLTGCAAQTDGHQGADDGDATQTAEELSAHAPIPYILQFVGTYDNAAATTGEVKTLTLTRTGRYTASIVGKSKLERGAFVGVSHYSGMPSDNVFHLITTGLGWTASIEGYTGKLQLTRSGHVTHVTSTSTVGPNESVCDASQGSWADDDADPSTGLYCICGSGKSYIPSAGGCVR